MRAARRFAFTKLLFVTGILIAGCIEPSAYQHAAGEDAYAQDADNNQASDHLLSAWTKSMDGKLQLRITVSASRLKAEAKIPLQVEVQNLSAEPVTVLKPFEDDHHDQTMGLEIDGPKGRCKYVGPTPTYVLGAGAFVTLGPQESTGGYFEIDPSNFESASEPGEYRLAYRYSADDGHKQSAEDRKLPAIWTGEIRSGALLFTRGDVSAIGGPAGGEPEQNVEIVFPKSGYRFTLAEAAAGVKLKYNIVVKKDLPGIVYLPQDGGGAMGSGPSGLGPFEKIHGNGQSYAELDIGLGRGPRPDAQTIKKGTYATTIDWNGRNWSGPSDTSMPKCKPFPAGRYQLTVTMIGNVDTPEGRRFYRLQRSAPLELTE